ncbi:JNK-interacting protein 3 isoform X2 [Tribolium castaneum]|uniref:JNK-interacting protein 3 isoform X2 n=1 Tax=Tribolium castaneum TaxID=7070 RepID=UPI00046C2781|nr:PREDICTED: JNK-interacting protein 3 isoform X2 [Tribolium castaneum]|eukprot:XP_008190561.1 PREDICTED: JNK-interacting protein 3 isoform X2 [Tribolium castaneum]
MDLADSGGGLGPETIYGTHEDSHVVMSEKVQSLAGSIYQEFERMIARYDEDVVKTLMPLLVNVLECLDAAYQQNQEHDVELELLREDNEQLVTQYEREKGARKAAEQKLLEFEDAAEGERKELAARLEALESIVRMLELKHKNSMEHAGRLEEREGELKKEYAKLHERYTELFKTHMDYMERTKLLLSGQQLANERAEAGRLNSNRINIGRSSGPISFGFTSLENAEVVDSVPSSPISSTHSSPSLHSELDNLDKKMVERGQETDSLNLENKSVITSPVSPPGQPTTNNNTGRLKKEQRSGNTLYQELSFQDVDGDDDGDITGGWVHPGEYASSGMGKEVENLIMENNELLATKNALNVVKDDLIVKVDELTGEIEMLREEILSLNVSRTKLRERISDLEEELRKVKEANEAKQDGADDESDVPMAQRKRFTRVEMARVLMERNQYKERFMELQEAVRWTEMIRASRNDTAFDKKSKQSIWRFFSNLFSGSERPQRPLVGPHLRYQTATNQIAPGVRALPRPGHDFVETELGSEKLALRRAVERREQYRQVRAHVRKEDGRLQAYGWSLPGKVGPGTKGTQSSSGVPVPVPVYCRPLAETTPGMKIWCAAGVNLMGGYTKDGGLMVGGSVFYSEEPRLEQPHTELETLDQELNAGREGALLETKLSSLVWICTYTHAASLVTVIDANNPAEILNSFGVCANHVLCIASVPGASPNDYNKTYTKINVSENAKDSSDNVVENKEDEGENNTNKTNDKNHEELEEAALIGKVTFVENDTSVVNKKDKYNNAKSTVDEEKIEEQPVEDETDENVGESDKNKTSNQEIMSSVLATMWLGAENGMVYVHSSVANWNQCLHSVKLKDAVISIVHINGRVVCALACGTLAIFARNDDGEWDLSRYHLVQVGLPHQSVRCLAVVGDKVWCGYRNKIHVLEPQELGIIHSLEAHPRRESPVRQIAWLGEGVWVSIRLDSTLRLYHAHTYQHLQDVDIEPYVSKMLGTGKLGFSFVRITCLLISSNRLWIGTSNGVIISVPLSENGANTGSIVPRGSTSLPGAGVRVAPVPGSFIPFCTMAHAQLSFHGHRDNVKFFVAVPGNGGMSAASTPSEALSTSATSIGLPPKQPSAMLVMSGGEGYIDFRVGDEMEDSVIDTETGDLEAAQGESKGEKSHLIVWQVSTS